MSDESVELDQGTRRIIEATMRTSSGRAVAILVRQLGDFDLAEEAVQDAWLDAVRTWGRDGTPDNPVGWIVATARRRAVDRLRRRSRTSRLADRIGNELLTHPDAQDLEADDADIPDDRLALLFTCCHPALGADARVALTLRAVAGLTTREIARAFGVSESTMQQRIVRTKQRIVSAGIPYRVPERHELHERLGSVHAVVYAMFTEGYAATDDPQFLRVDLTSEAIRLARLVDRLLPDEPESLGLLALLLLHDARRTQRRRADGGLVLLDDQDRDSWDRRQIEEGITLLDRAAAMRRPGPFQIQAAIAALHAEAASVDATDWVQVAALYSQLIEIWPATGARLAHAVAIGMADGGDAGLRALERLDDLLGNDHRWHAAAAHFHEAAGSRRKASEHFERAADLAGHPLEAERLRQRAAVTRP